MIAPLTRPTSLVSLMSSRDVVGEGCENTAPPQQPSPLIKQHPAVQATSRTNAPGPPSASLAALAAVATAAAAEASPSVNPLLRKRPDGPACCAGGEPPLKKRQHTTALAAAMAATRATSKIIIRPSDYARSAFRANGSDVGASSYEAQFRSPTPAMIAAYTPDLLTLVRNNDLDGLKRAHKEGGHRSVNGCNRFGESLLHLACRRGHTDMVKYLLLEGDADLNIRDDYNRTPLHDACWTCQPNLELVDLLVRMAPEQVLMEDVRGFTPFDYARREHWGVWLRFLWERKSILRTKTTPASSPPSSLLATRTSGGCADVVAVVGANANAKEQQAPPLSTSR